MSVFRQHAAPCAFPAEESWVILSPIEAAIKRKIEAVGTPLSEWDISINYGIKTGCNEAFVITTARRDEILAACRDEAERERTAELIRPILRGRDIKRYGYEWAELWVIAARLQTDIPNKYPAICEHLKQYKGKGKLGDNSTTKVFQRPWWAWMQEPVNYWEDFNKPKVMWKIIGCNINFSFDFDGMLCNNAVNIMTGNELQLLQFVGLMNSKLFDWYLKLTTEAEVQGGGIQLYVTTLEKTLLKLNFPDRFSALVNRRVKEEVADADIDAAIYELYGLSLEEIDYVNTLKDI